jgi:hypothetical protein
MPAPVTTPAPDSIPATGRAPAQGSAAGSGWTSYRSITPGPAPTPRPTPQPHSKEIYVYADGRETDAGTLTVKGDTSTVTVNEQVIEREIQNANDNVTVIIPTGANTAEALFELKMLNVMANKDMTLTVQTGGVKYNIPSTAVDTAAAMAALKTADPAQALVSVAITPYKTTPAFIQNAVNNSGMTLITPPIEFTVTATCNGRTTEINEFTKFVNRVIEVTEEQAGQITTAKAVEPTGMLRHVPTYVYQEGGKGYAIIYSLTNSIYVLVFNEVTFPDAAGKWYQDIVNEMGSRGIITDAGSGLFDGESPISRANFVAVIVRALGLPVTQDGTVFNDVSPEEWYSGYVNKAYQYNLATGISDDLFEPERPITRQETDMVLWKKARLADYKGNYADLNAFTDTEDMSPWARNAESWSVGSGLITGANNLLRPTESITHADAAALILNLLQKAGLVDVRVSVPDIP